MQRNVSDKPIKDFVGVLLSNVIVLISSVLGSLIIPKLLGIVEYGYYKTYTLYMTYTALFHFGFIDGILLKYAGVDYESLDKMKLRCFSKFYLSMQCIISIIMICALFPFLSGIYKFVGIAVAIDTFFTNITSYYQFVSQCTMRFKELSVRKILFATLKIIAVFFLMLLYRRDILSHITCVIYVTAILLINCILTVWYIFTYREITFGEAYRISTMGAELKELFSTGIVLTLSFQIANLIFSIDRQFVSILFPTSVYGVYSFAYSIIGMATTVIGAISTVLLPNLRRRGVDEIKNDFPMGIAIVSILVFAAMCMFFPLKWFVYSFLDEYSDSVEYLRIIFPGLVLSSCITAIIFTYYKAVCGQKAYCVISCLILIISAFTNWLGYIWFKSPEAISWASVVSLAIWFCVATQYLAKTYHFKWKKEVVYILVESICFYITTSIFKNQFIEGMLTFSLFYLISTIVIFGKKIKLLFSMVSQKKAKPSRI